jgi:hypothetical protein
MCELCGNYDGHWHLGEEQYCEDCYNRIIYGDDDDEDSDDEDDEYFYEEE